MKRINTPTRTSVFPPVSHFQTAFGSLGAAVTHSGAGAISAVATGTGAGSGTGSGATGRSSRMGAAEDAGEIATAGSARMSGCALVTVATDPPSRITSVSRCDTRSASARTRSSRFSGCGSAAASPAGSSGRTAACAKSAGLLFFSQRPRNTPAAQPITAPQNSPIPAPMSNPRIASTMTMTPSPLDSLLLLRLRRPEPLQLLAAHAGQQALAVRRDAEFTVARALVFLRRAFLEEVRVRRELHLVAAHPVADVQLVRRERRAVV